MTSVKYIGMDVHTESTSIAVRNSLGKIVMEGVIETKANTILQFLDGLRGDLRVVFEEGTWATWLYDLLKSHVTEVLVCNTRKNAVRKGSKSDRIDARKLAEQLYMNNVKSVYHGARLAHDEGVARSKWLPGSDRSLESGATVSIFCASDFPPRDPAALPGAGATRHPAADSSVRRGAARLLR